MNENLKKFLELVEPSDWLVEVEYRIKNRDWLRKSQQIAIKILQSLHEKNISKEELALKSELSLEYINKIVKGGENLTLETISKLENALKIKL